jgi:sortase A
MTILDEPATQSAPPPRRRRGLRRAGLAIGALLIAASLAILGSVAWDLWGTGIATARAQHRLGQEFRSTVTPAATKSATTSAGVADVVPTPIPHQPSNVALGGLFGHLVIPRIGVNDYVVEGVGAAQLAEGPGHYPGTAQIGGPGNVGIAGHRTTHGAPFYDLNELQPGDLIYLTNLAGHTFTYRVTTHFIVLPSDGAVLNPTKVPSLTLTTCNPRYSASQRLIVQASLVPAATHAS